MKARKVIISIIVFVILVMQGLSCWALTPDNISPDTTNGNLDKLATTGATIIKIIQYVGTIVSVGVVLVLGIKYMMGSVEEKAEYKKTMLPYLIGAILLFAASNIVGIIQNISL